jgi:hypothetical protein
MSAGEPNTPLYEGALDAEVAMQKRGTGADEGVTFFHLRWESAPGAFSR